MNRQSRGRRTLLPFPTRVAAVVAAVATALPVAAISAPLQVGFVKDANPCVALTFDDGPDPVLTPKLLSILEAKGVNATFFVIGEDAAKSPDLIVREDHDGNDVGNHTWDHPALPKLSSSAALRELSRTDDLINQLVGHQPPFTRAPYGSLTEHVAALSPRTYIGWTVDTLDWRYPDVARITSVAVSKAANGSIILMHDTHPKTIEAVPGVIDGLQQRGFRLVTVSQLFAPDCRGDAGVQAATLSAPASPSTARPSTVHPVSAGAKSQAKPPVTPAASASAAAPLDPRPRLPFAAAPTVKPAKTF